MTFLARSYLLLGSLLIGCLVLAVPSFAAEAPAWLTIPEAVKAEGEVRKADDVLYRFTTKAPSKEVLAAYEAQFKQANLNPQTKYNGIGWSLEATSQGQISLVKVKDSDGVTEVAASYTKSVFAPSSSAMAAIKPENFGAKRTTWPKWLPRVQSLDAWKFVEWKSHDLDKEAKMGAKVSSEPFKTVGYYRRILVAAGFDMQPVKGANRALAFGGSALHDVSVQGKGYDPDNGRYVSIIVWMWRDYASIDAPFNLTLHYKYE